MQQRIKIIVCASTVCLAIIMASVTIGSLRAEGEEREHPAASQTRENGYVVMEHSGRIAVFSAANLDRPLKVTNIRINSLRESDRLMLSSGLAVPDETKLAQLLEDLGS